MAEKTESITVIDSDQLQDSKEAGVTLIDVRPVSMFEAGHIPGAISVPLVVPEDGSMIPDDAIVAAVEAAGVTPDDDMVLYCQTGLHAGLAAKTLEKEGFSRIELYSGSMNDWAAKNLPVEE